MNRTVFLNGEYLDERDAKVSIFDRGFLMADAVYEVTAVLDGKLVDFPGHAGRLKRSLRELGLANPLSYDELLSVHRELIRRNTLSEGLVYVQISRGAADRSFLFPKNTAPTVVLFTQAHSIIDRPAVRTGMHVVTVDDARWKRRDIKTVQLLPSSMARTAAHRSGRDDAWMVEGGFITEGTSNTAYIVADGRIVTRGLGPEILPGITRAAVLRLAAELNIPIEERPFTPAEAVSADEAFITSATTFVTSVVSIDDTQIGDGTPGPIARKLRAIYIEEARAGAL